MNKLPTAKRAAILSMLCEGNSMRSVSRLADVSINTVSKLLVDAGLVCAAFHDENVRGLKPKRVQCDEIWAFCGAKEKKATPEQKAEGWGDVWTWTALDADSKLLVSFRVGDRGPHACYEFVKDVAARLSSRERQVLALRFCDDMTQTQIAELIGVSQMQVSRILRRSIARLTELTEVQPPAS